MKRIVVTGSSGLIGSESCKFFHDKGYYIIGIDNNMRSYFFGENASTDWNTSLLKNSLTNFEHHHIDIRSFEEIEKLFIKYNTEIVSVIHTAAQPSHDWAAREPFTDFTINANGTLNLLEATRKHCITASFIFTSTNKVYGDTPNRLPLEEKEYRWELAEDHPYFENGIDEEMSIDNTKHSIFGASKVAADVMVQEYGRYFGMKTVVFRGGCLTGPAHSGAVLHGFLAYLILCAINNRPYTIFGYKGKQVRDNIHSKDLISAFWHYIQAPKPGEVYNMGGGRFANISMLEAINLIKKISGNTLQYSLQNEARSGDHIWYISDVKKFQHHYPLWTLEYDITRTITEMILVAQQKALLQ